MNLARIITLAPRGTSERELEGQTPESMPPGLDRESYAASLWERGDLEAAAAAWTDILKRDPSRLPARLQLAACHQQLRRWDDASREFSLCLPMAPENPDLLTHLALCFFHTGTVSHAVVLLKQALKLSPNHPLAQQALGMCDRGLPAEPETGPIGLLAWDDPEPVAAPAALRVEPDDSRERLEEILWLEPENGDALFRLALFYHREGRKGWALRLYEQAVRANPQAWQPAFNLGLLRFEQGDSSAARLLLDRVLLLKPDCADATWMLGQTHEQQGNRREAEFWYERTVALDPEAEDAWFRLGQLALERQDWPFAAVRFERCGPEHYEAAYNAAMCRRRIGDIERARVLLRKAVDLSHERPDALVAWAAIELECGDQATAEALERRLVNPQAGLSLALAETAATRPDAIRHYRRALEADPAQPGAWANLGSLLREEGDEEGARLAWREAIRYDPSLAPEYFG